MKKSFLLAFIVLVTLAACAAPTPSQTAAAPTSQPSPSIEISAVFNPACGESGLLDKGNSVSVESELGEHPGWTRYIDPFAGFTFVFPTNWKIYQKGGVICLSSNANPGHKLVIAFKSTGTPDVILQPAQIAGETSFGGQVLFLNQRIDKESLTSGSGLTAVLYNTGDAVLADGLSFSLSYGNWRSAGDETPLSDADQMNADLILESLSLVEVSHWSSASPDGSLTAFQTQARPADISALGQVYQRVDIVNQNGSVVWTPVDRWQEQALGMTYYKPVRWSADGRFFFFTQAVWGDGCVVFPADGSTLEKVDAATGKVTELFGGWAFSIALSPDEAQLAYVAEGRRGLVFRDLATSAERSVSIDPGWDFQAGYLTWSSDGKFLALTLANLPCRNDDPYIDPFAKSTSTLLVNTSTLEVRTLIAEDPQHRIVLGWKSPGVLELKDPTGIVSLLETGT